MSRPIKFRAWNESRKECTYSEMFDHLSVFFALCEQVCILDQFTGLRDKNSKEIYEGDMISGGLLSEPCEVMYQESCGRFIAFGEHYKVLANKFDQFEVIGNIHENQELLK